MTRLVLRFGFGILVVLVATFFMIGRHAAEHPRLVERVAAAGHVIGNHGYSHRYSGVWRGGAFQESANLSRSAARMVLDPRVQQWTAGFRVCLPAEDE